MINLIAGGHQQVHDQVEQFLNTLADPTAASTAGALDAAAKYYQATDETKARELDATYPSVDPGAAKEETEPVEANVGAFHDVADPTARYQPPTAAICTCSCSPSRWGRQGSHLRTSRKSTRELPTVRRN